METLTTARQAGYDPAPQAARLPRLLYLGNALPPGVSAVYPECQPAGHLVETSLVQSLQPWFDIRSVGCSGLHLERLQLGSLKKSHGLANALNLSDRSPEIYHRHRSLWRLKQAYLKWQTQGWQPEIILVCNLSPIYDAFVRWLNRRGKVPITVLYLADSNTLGTEVPWLKRLRYRFKPLMYPEKEMVPYFAACVAVNPATEKLFSLRGLPWLWLPNGCDPSRAIPSPGPERTGPLCFGYVGALGPHTGLPALLRVFLARERASLLHICGFGKARAGIAETCQSHPPLRFHLPRTPNECLQLSTGWDVLINPRPVLPENQNNFPSKLFEYALSGRAILSSNISGAEEILGVDAYYFEAHNFDAALDQRLEDLAGTPRQELDRRGSQLQQRFLSRYSWAQQGARLAEFLNGLRTSYRGRSAIASAKSPSLL